MQNNTTTQTDSLFVKELLIKFFRDIDYRRDDPIAEDNVSYLALKAEFAPYNTGPWFDALCRRCALVAELTYRSHSDEVRIIVSRCTWFLLYIDDGRRFPEYLMDFQKRVLTENSDSPKDDFFQVHREFLTDFYQLYDPVVANCIVLSCLDFVNGCILEETPTIRTMKLTQASKSWPNFLRRKTGHAYAYAFMLFPKECNLDMSTYIHAIDDMSDFINLTNDLLSFYKEDLAGEKNNYVHNRAFVTNKTVKETLQDIAEEALAAHQRTINALESTASTDALTYWKKYANGYIEFHFIEGRYRLPDLNIDIPY